MVIVVSVMFRVACSLLCYVVLYSIIMFYLLVFPFICLCLLVEHVDVGDGLRCMTIGFSDCCCYACSVASSWLNTCMVAFLICSCMIFIADASSLAMFLSKVLVMFMLGSMPCSIEYMICCCYVKK